MTARTLFVTAAVLSLLACDQKRGTQADIDLRHNRTGAGTPVATFGGDSITAEEIQQRLMEMHPYARSQFQSPERRKQYVEDMARFELAVAEAIKRGLANDPKVVMATKNALVLRLREQETEEKASPVSDQEVAAYYEKHKADYVKPEMIRLAHVFLAGPKDDAAKRSAAKAKAAEVLAQAQKLIPTDYQAFAQLVRQHSEDPNTKALDGDMRFLSLEEIGKQFGPEVAQAAQPMTRIGEVTPELVETEKGFHVVRLLGRQAALNLTQEQVRPQIQAALLHQRKQARMREMLEQLEKTSGLKIDEQALGKVQFDAKAPAVTPQGPAPGLLPLPPPAR